MTLFFWLLKKTWLPERKSILSFALWIAVFGVTLGVIQLTVVLAVMTGFQNLLQRNYTRISSEIVVIPKTMPDSKPDMIRSLSGVPSVQAVSPFLMAAGMLIKEGVAGAVLEGVDYDSSKRVTPWQEIWLEEPLWDLQKSNPQWIWVGEQLARKLNLTRGATVDLLIAEGEERRTVPFVVTAITKFGIYDHDMRYAQIDFSTLQTLFKKQKLEPMYKVLTTGEVDSSAHEIKQMLGQAAAVKKWSDINQNIFLAVEHQKGMLHVILQLIIALAAVNVMNLLIMNSQSRKKEIAILKALGVRANTLVIYFVGHGLLVGVIGITLGLFFGTLFCRFAEWLQPTLLSESIYNVSKLPFQVNAMDSLWIAIGSMLICGIFSVIPALRAAYAKPINTLRDDT